MCGRLVHRYLTIRTIYVMLKKFADSSNLLPLSLNSPLPNSIYHNAPGLLYMMHRM